MAKITRVFQKLFGSNGTTTDFGQFGSLAAGSPTTTKDPATIQGLSAFLDGWASAVISSNRPALEDLNGLFLLQFRQLAYLFQEGIAEYDSSTEYHRFSVVKKTGTFELYGSLINTNVGNALPSQVDDANWQYLGDLSNLNQSRYVPGQIVMLDYEPSAGDLTSYKILHADGSAVSRTTYANLFAKVGVIHGQGDGSTTFNLPDWRGRFPRGWDDGAGVDPDAGSRVADATGGVTGDEVGSVQDEQYKSHRHSIDANDETPGANPYIFDNNINAAVTQTRYSNYSGGSETRPKNKNAWIGIAY